MYAIGFLATLAAVKTGTFMIMGGALMITNISSQD